MKRRIVGAAVSACALGALAVVPASAGAYSAACSVNPASGGGSFASSRGEIDNVTAGASEDGSAIVVQYSGTNRQGDPFNSQVGCGVEGSRNNTVTVTLGDGDDNVRSDGRDIEYSFATIGPLDAAFAVAYRGGSGDDKLLGNIGGGVLRGGPGDDVIRDKGGHDVLRGGPGNDTINARDGARDLISCGSGSDSVKADPFDTLQGCR